MLAEATSGQNVGFASAAAPLPRAVRTAVEVLDRARGLQRIARLRAEVAAVGIEAGQHRLEQQARDRGASARIGDRFTDAERAHHALLGVVEAVGTRLVDHLAEELRDVHALVAVVRVAVVADGDRVRIAAGVNAAHHFVVREPHHGDVAGGVAGDECIGAVRRDGDAARLDAHVDGAAERHRRVGGEVDDAHGAVDGVGHVGAAVVGRERHEARLVAHGHFGEQLRGVGAVGVAHANHGHAGLLAVHDHGAIVIAGERDAARARLAEQQLVTRQRFVGTDERAIERRGERHHRGVAGERGNARREIQRPRAGDGGADGGVRGGIDLEAVARVVVGIEQRQQAQQVG